MKGKYVYSFSDDCFQSDFFDTPEEALAEAREIEKESLAPEKKEAVYIGVVGEKWKPTIDGESIIDMLRDEAYEEGGEYAEDYLKDVSEAQRDELTEVLTNAFNKWAAKYGYKPNFYPIENVKEYKL